MARYDKWRKHRRNHSKIRAAERYRLRLTNQDLENIAGMIRNGKSIASHRISQSKSVHLLHYQDTSMVVLYSKRHQEIITFLPEDCDKARRLEAAICD